MSPKPEVTEILVRKRLDEHLARCGETNTRPSVLALARQLGLSNTTFRRRFPDIAGELAGHRASPASTSTGTPSTQDRLIARNARLRRSNHELTAQLALAAAQLQHLAIENARLRGALEEAAKVTRLPAPRR